MQRALANQTRQPRQDKFRLAAKKALIDEGITVTALARRLGLARNTVSMAINHPVYPTVRSRIAEALALP